MRTHAAGKLCVLALVGAVLVAALPTSAAAQPVVKTVPWVATNPLIPHDTWSGKSIRLKGTTDVTSGTWTWDFGDGSPPATGTVTAANRYLLEATHAYTGTTGQVFTARLTVETGGLSTSASYYLVLRDRLLPIEVNVAIDEGLWYLHKTMSRYVQGGLDYGSWMSGCSGHACANYIAVQAANVNAFFVNGHREDGPTANPYVETVQRAMRRLFYGMATGATAPQTYTVGGYNAGFPGPIVNDPDCSECAAGDPSRNGLYAYIGNDTYQMGIVLTAVAASGTPTRLTQTGPATIIGRTYRAVLQDLVDWFVWGQNENGGSSGFGGWHYGANYGSADNSTAQWGAISLLAARGFGKGQYSLADPGIQFPDVVKLANPYWLKNTYYSSGYCGTNGVFLYQAGYNPWSLWATTPSGMVQLALDEMGRGGTNVMWEKTEACVRANFANTGSCNGVKEYYYGLYAFVKAMLLHVNEDTKDLDPITLLGGDLDWYAAEAALGAPTDGVARTLVGDQGADGSWWGHHCGSAEQQYFETSWAIQMLNRTITEAGAPVAVATVTPASAVVGQTVTFGGAGSFHQDSSKAIDSWAWEICKTAGTPIASCPTVENKTGVVVTSSFGALGLYQARLTVTDNGVPEHSASTIVTVNVSIPPLAPTANAGGPYGFCPGATPWFLDGTGSVNPDDGASEPGSPPDFIKEYAWDLDGDGAFDDALGAQPDVTAFFMAQGVGSYLVQLRVKDNTKLSFPSSGMNDLTGTATAQVTVRAATDPLCSCNTVTARAKPTKADLVWTVFPGAASYHVYRGTTSGGPYLYIANATGTVYADFGLVNGATYYWVVRPALANTSELCQSNQAAATPRAR